MEWEFLLIDFCSDEVNELLFNEIEIDKGKSASLLSLSSSTQLNNFYSPQLTALYTTIPMTQGTLKNNL